jgi:DNA polymerase III delta subunit
MASKELKNLIENLEKGKIFNSITIVGENAFLYSEIKNLADKISFSLKRFSVNKQGPGSDIEAEAMGMGLFGGGTLLWIKSSHSPDHWTSDGQRLFDKISKACDGQSLAVVLELPADKKKAKSSDLGASVISAEIQGEDLHFWIQRINQRLPDKLSPDKLDFLLSFEADLLQYSQWMELWSLGGDLWAEMSLGWQGKSPAGEGLTHVTKQAPAFALVDYILNKQKKEAMKFLELVFASQQDPLQLLGLLSRNARLLNSVQMGETPDKTPPFVIQKLKKSRLAGWKWLKECAELDSMMKTSALDAKALYARMLDRIL